MVSQRYTIGLIIFLAITIPLAINQDNAQNQAWQKLQSNFEQQITSRGISLVTANVDSPSVIIPLSTQQQFLDKIQELNATVVYRNDNMGDYAVNYYVFTANLLMAYSFTLQNPY